VKQRRHTGKGKVATCLASKKKSRGSPSDYRKHGGNHDFQGVTRGEGKEAGRGGSEKKTFPAKEESPRLGSERELFVKGSASKKGGTEEAN